VLAAVQCARGFLRWSPCARERTARGALPLRRGEGAWLP
jgi:hypothetical protein